MLTFDEKLAAVRGWFAAFNARDVRALCAAAHPAIEIAPQRPLMPNLTGTAFHGHAGLRTLMQWTFDHYPRIHVELDPPRETGISVTAKTTFVYDVEQVPRVRRDVWAVFGIEAQGIRRIHAYGTIDEARAATRHNATLTPREREVFALLASGLTATQIADQLVLSPLTVRTHIQNAKDRLGARTRMEALSIALTRGEISA
jgi:DNA-binding CsgD family transcriptional regulator/ketosteroid isomerase-like protein